VGCPSCGAFLLSLLGVTAGLSALPFAGLELWFVSCVIMAYTLWRSVGLLNAQGCGPATGGGACSALPPASRAHVALLALLNGALAGLLLWAMIAHEPLLAG
jgi:hypothetical protein